MKSKLIMLASIVVFFVVSVIVMLFFEAIGLSTMGYGYSPNWMDETIEWGETMTFTGVYSAIFAVLIATRTHWLLSGETTANSDIKLITGWWYWLFGSTAWLVIIYLIGLINIRPPIIESLIETVVSLALLLYLYKHYLSKIRKINLQQQLKANKDAEDNLKDSQPNWKDQLSKAILVGEEEWQKAAMERLAEETIEANQNSENLKGSKPSWTDQVMKSLDVTPEEWEKVWMEQLAEETIEANKLREGREKSSRSKSPFGLVEEGTSRAWLFIGDEGDAPLRGLDGNWSNEEVVMPNELSGFRIASSNELFALLREASASLRDMPSLSKAVEKASPEPFALIEEGTLRAVLLLGVKGVAPLRGLDGTWSKIGVVMPDELGDFRIASKSELLDLLIDAESSLKNNSVLTEAIAKEINKKNKGK